MILLHAVHGAIPEDVIAAALSLRTSHAGIQLRWDGTFLRYRFDRIGSWSTVPDMPTYTRRGYTLMTPDRRDRTLEAIQL